MGWVGFLTMRHLGSPLKRGVRFVIVLATFGVALGVATLTLTQAVAVGLEKIFHDSILGFNAHLVVQKMGEMEDPQGETKRIRELLGDEVLATTPFLYREVLLVSHGKVKGAVLKGIDPLTFNQVYAVKVRPRAETQVPANIKDLLQAPADFPRVVLGKDLAEALGISGEGANVKIFVPSPQAAGKKVTGTFQVFAVSGIFETGISKFDEAFAIVDLGAMQKVFDKIGWASGIEIKLKDPDRAIELEENHRQNFLLPYDVRSWQKLNAPFFRALTMERILFFLIMGLVVVVAAFNIVGVLLLLIFDKTREISILRALGASESGLKRIFGLTGLMLGGAGSILGVVMGFGVAFLIRSTGWIRPVKEIHFVDRLPVEISLPLVAVVIGASLAITLIATWFGVSRLKSSGLDL